MEPEGQTAASASKPLVISTVGVSLVATAARRSERLRALLTDEGRRWAEGRKPALVRDALFAAPPEAIASALTADIAESSLADVSARSAELTALAIFELIAATNEFSEALVAERRLRPDLLDRIGVIRIDIPPLRERPEDVREIARALAARNRLAGVRATGITDAALDRLAGQLFPGNVRELQNVIVRASLDAEGGWIEPRHLAFLPEPPGAEERARILAALEGAGWVQRDAAHTLGCSAGQLSKRMKTLGMVRPVSGKARRPWKSRKGVK